MLRGILPGALVAGAPIARGVEWGLAGGAVKPAPVAAPPEPAATPAATTTHPPTASPARPASVPTAGDVWVCQWGVGGPGGLSANQKLSSDCQRGGTQNGISGTPVRTQVATSPSFARCGHWDVHQVHLDSNVDGPNANTAHYDENWQLIPSGVC